MDIPQPGLCGHWSSQRHRDRLSLWDHLSWECDDLDLADDLHGGDADDHYWFVVHPDSSEAAGASNFNTCFVGCEYLSCFRQRFG